MNAKPKALFDLMLELFKQGDIVRFVENTYGSSVSSALPSATSTLDDLAFECVRVLRRRGLIGRMLFDSLLAERPSMYERIADVASLHGYTLNRPDTTDGKPDTVAKANVIFAIGADPPRVGDGQLEPELHKKTIEACILETEHGARFELVFDFPATDKWVSIRLRKSNPRLVHVVAHGFTEPAGLPLHERDEHFAGVYLTDEKNNAFAVRRRVLQRMLGLPKIEGVVLASCYTKNFASDLCANVSSLRWAVGMSGIADPRDSVRFTQRFYNGLFSGLTVSDAFDDALMMLPDEVGAHLAGRDDANYSLVGAA